jgi:hypothetical protein
MWLEHLPASQIDNWDDLVRTFVGTSRAHMCTLGTPGICAHAPRSPASRSGTSYGASPSVVQSSRALPSPRSCTPSSRAQPAETSCASLGVARRSTPTSCSTSPLALPPARRRWGLSSTARRASARTTRPRREQVQGAPAEAQARQEGQEVAPRGARVGTRRRRGRGPRS